MWSGLRKGSKSSRSTDASADSAATSTKQPQGSGAASSGGSSTGACFNVAHDPTVGSVGDSGKVMDGRGLDAVSGVAKPTTRAKTIGPHNPIRKAFRALNRLLPPAKQDEQHLQMTQQQRHGGLGMQQSSAGSRTYDDWDATGGQARGSAGRRSAESSTNMDPEQVRY